MKGISLIKTALINRHLHIRSSRILVYHNTVVDIDKTAKINAHNGRLSINKPWTKRNDKIGFLFSMSPNSKLDVNGNFDIYSGGKIYINEGATLHLGSGYINHNVNISVFDKIHIGDNCVISENVTIRDSDNHSIKFQNGDTHNPTAPIFIGNHVWIGMNVTILKGVTIGDGAIIGANSLVCHDVPENTLVGGVPAKTIRSNISWN